jgi:integrase
MAANKVINSETFHDGKIVIYQLENRPKQKWLCRIKIPNGSGYVYRGTGTSDLYEARKFADQIYDEMRLKVMAGETITRKDFRRLLGEFEKNYPTEAPSQGRVNDICLFLKTYALPYFTKNTLTELTEAGVTRFFDWRRANPKRTTPSNATIRAEMSHFKTFSDWCYRRGYLGKQVEFRRPSLTENRRPHFNESDWTKLTRFLREWVKAAKGKSGPIYRDRVMLTNYVLVLANTGIRVGEARALKWSDIDSFTGDDEKENIVLQVRGKTGAREVVARTPAVKEYLQRIYELRTSEIGSKPRMSESIFCHNDGSPIHSFKKGFNSLIKEAGVEFDSEGQRRVIYSLRHTYATFRLHEGVNVYTLARNMGTSVKMLESFYGHTSNRAMASELTKTRAKQRKQLPWEKQ